MHGCIRALPNLDGEIVVRKAKSELDYAAKIGLFADSLNVLSPGRLLRHAARQIPPHDFGAGLPPTRSHP